MRAWWRGDGLLMDGWQNWLCSSVLQRGTPRDKGPLRCEMRPRGWGAGATGATGAAAAGAGAGWGCG
ncbi:hypothetical protein BS50DRAFT_577867 [Corynespora cassiicola Philippines]|uniref:Uncharacterized protein n=1 Tax=Corynespora cassiicola Philippines TaxID=1448308 RepID=A0A2T2N983_CORCC|nr:hypothetical protein BS50DRAFT_577867 [Corynespora cassiicola Philippines]